MWLKYAFPCAGGLEVCAHLRRCITDSTSKPPQQCMGLGTVQCDNITTILNTDGSSATEYPGLQYCMPHSLLFNYACIFMYSVF